MPADLDAFMKSAIEDESPPVGISLEAEAVWHLKAGNWQASHDIAQDLSGSLGSWIHAHLHLVEGDLGNAGYWYAHAGRPARGPEEIEAEWRELAAAVLGAS